MRIYRNKLASWKIATRVKASSNVLKSKKALKKGWGIFEFVIKHFVCVYNASHILQKREVFSIYKCCGSHETSIEIKNWKVVEKNIMIMDLSNIIFSLILLAQEMSLELGPISHYYVHFYIVFKTHINIFCSTTWDKLDLDTIFFL